MALSNQENLTLRETPGFVPTMVAVASAFGAWSILLPVVPLFVLDSGGSATLAGWSTGAFMAATVATQIMTPRMLRTLGYRPVMAGASFMLGIPALGHMLGADTWSVILFSALRGIGFGAICVAESALIAELVPQRMLGKATAMLGVFVGLSQMVFLPAGLAIADFTNYNVVFVLAAIIALIAAFMCLRIPSLKAEPITADSGDGIQRAAMWKLVLVPALALTTISMSFGVVSSFLPATVKEMDPESGALFGGLMLSLVGGACIVGRYAAGSLADRTGTPGAMMIPSQILAFIGVAIITAGVVQEWSIWAFVLGAVLFGLGFGSVQNESLLSMFARLPRHRISEASAVWNVFYDGGTGVGSVLLGAMVAGLGYAGAYGAGAAIIIAGALMSVLDWILGRNRISEFDNIKTRLTKLRPKPRVPRPPRMPRAPRLPKGLKKK